MKYQIYVTYGKGNKFELDRINLNLNLKDWLGKPACAWWGSPINAKFGWKQWCQNEQFIEDEISYFTPYNTIYWRLKAGTKILKINSLNDLEWCVRKNYIYRDTSDPDWVRYRWNFTALVYNEYAAIQLFNPYLGDSINELENIMYRWSCESIVVLDPDKIIQVQLNKKGRKKIL